MMGAIPFPTRLQQTLQNDALSGILRSRAQRGLKPRRQLDRRRSRPLE